MSRRGSQRRGTVMNFWHTVRLLVRHCVTLFVRVRVYECVCVLVRLLSTWRLRVCWCVGRACLFVRLSLSRLGSGHLWGGFGSLTIWPLDVPGVIDGVVLCVACPRCVSGLSVGFDWCAGKRQCGREGCLHLHQVATRPEDVFTREEASARRLPPPPPSFLFSSSTGSCSHSSGPPPPTALPATGRLAPTVPVSVLPVSLPGRPRRLSPPQPAASAAAAAASASATSATAAAAPSSAAPPAAAAPAPLPVVSLSPARLSLAASASGRRRFPPPSREAAGGWGAAADAIDASSPAAAAAAARAASKAASTPGSARKTPVALSGKASSLSSASGVAPSMTLSPSSAWSSGGGQSAWAAPPTVWSSPPATTVWSSPPVLAETSPSRSSATAAASSSSSATGPTLLRSATLGAGARDVAPPPSAWACVPAAVARPAPAVKAVGGSFRPPPPPPPGFAPPGFGPLPTAAASIRPGTNEWGAPPTSGGAGSVRSLGQPKLTGGAGRPSGIAAPGGPGCVAAGQPAAAATAAPSDARFGAPRRAAADRVAAGGGGPSPGLTSPPGLTGSPIHPSPRTSPRSCSRFGFARRREGAVGGGGAKEALTPTPAPAPAPALTAPPMSLVGGGGGGGRVDGGGSGGKRTVPDFLGAPGATGGSAGRPARTLPVLGAVSPGAGALPPPSPPAAATLAVGGGRGGTGGRRRGPTSGSGRDGSLPAAAPLATKSVGALPVPVGASHLSSLGLGPSLSQSSGDHQGTPPSPAGALGPGALESIPSNMTVSPTRGSPPPGDSVDSPLPTPTLLTLLGTAAEASAVELPTGTALSVADATPPLAAGGLALDAGTRAAVGGGGGDCVASAKSSTPSAPPGFGPPRCVPPSDAFLVSDHSLEASFCGTSGENSLAPVCTSVSNVTLPPPSPSSGSTSIMSSPGLPAASGPRLPSSPSCAASLASPPEATSLTRSSALGPRASPAGTAIVQRAPSPLPPRSRLLASGIMDAAHAVWRSLVTAASGVGRSSKGGGGGWRGAGADGDEGSSATEDDGDAGDADSAGDDGSQTDDGELDEDANEEEEGGHARFPPTSASVASMGMPCGRNDSAVGRYGALMPSWSAEGETS